MTAALDARTPADALASIADGLDDTTVGALVGRPSLVLDLSSRVESDDVVRLTRALAGAPCVVIGVASEPRTDRGLEDLLDVALCGPGAVPAPWVAGVGDPAVEAAHLVAAVDRSPVASVALVQLLRLGASSAVADAVVAESFVYSLLQGGARHREWLASRSERTPRPRPDRPVVRVERAGDEVEIVLDRPEVHNAYGTRMRDELVDALRLVAVDRSIARVVLRGEGPSFSSGGDLDEFGTAPVPLDAHLVRTTRNAGIALAAVADRATVRVHGTCVGAGVELPAFAGWVVAEPDTTFLLPEIEMGLIPGAGGTASIPRRIGRHRAAHLAIAGRPIDATTAAAWGLVDAVEVGR